MLNTPFPPWPSFTQEEAEVVSRVLLSNRVNYWTGNEGREFEKEFAISSASKYAVALANGTVALDAALKAVGVGPGDEVVVTPRTFLASASSVVGVGAVPVFADVDRDSQNITAATVSAALSAKTKAIVCVHLAGWPCEMEPIMALANKHDLHVIEDCAQAHGARCNDQSVGSIGHIAGWSFCQDKIITTGGEGGMVTTNVRDFWSKIWSYKDHGKSWEAVHEREHPPGFRWLHDSFGTNGRMTEMQAALGRVQLRRLPSWVNRRRENAQLLNERFAKLPGLRTTVPPSHIHHAYYKYYAFVVPQHLRPGWDRDRIMNEVTTRGVPCYAGACPEIYLEKAFRDAGFAPAERLPVARELGETALMFLVHPTLGASHMQRCADVVQEVMLQASS